VSLVQAHLDPPNAETPALPQLREKTMTSKRRAISDDVQLEKEAKRITGLWLRYRNQVALTRSLGRRVAMAARQPTPRTDAPESDPLNDVRRAIRLCAAPRAALMACLREQIENLREKEKGG
jgi:hypothetical protein